MKETVSFAENLYVEYTFNNGKGVFLIKMEKVCVVLKDTLEIKRFAGNAIFYSSFS